MKPELSEKLERLPAAPGVYLFKDEAGAVLYVGKARSLRSRVRSYFSASSSDTRFFISHLDRVLGDIETVVVGNEKEAALLENNLIKQHQPRYNFKLRDDKEFLSLRLNTAAEWPRLEVVRRPEPDGAQYFGPYDSATAARSTLRVVNRHFQLRTCSDAELARRTRPCLQYQIKRCPAPCVYEVDREQYGEGVADVGLFLDGRHEELVAVLQERMAQAAASLQYELAAQYRDQLRAVERVREKNRVVVVDTKNQDVLGLFRRADQAEVAVLKIRAGKLTEVATFLLRQVCVPDDEVLSSFLREYYAPGMFIPEEILLPMPVEAMDGLAEMLGEFRGRKVTLLAPQRGTKLRLVAMAQENAAHAFNEKSRARDDLEGRLGHLQQRLRLPRLPRRIECVDVSHTGGADTVASVVALHDTAPDRSRYRSFHLKRVRGGDDYGAMYEVLARRLHRGRANEAGWELPDLLVVDGGKGQLGVAQQVLHDLGVEDLPVVGLAKEKENALGELLVDRVYVPGQKNPVELREHAALGILALARDEAHRSSNALRLKLGKRRRLRSRLDDVPGVGPKTRARLLKAFGSVRAIENADDAALRAAGASRAQADAIRQHLSGAGGRTPAPEPPQGERLVEVTEDRELLGAEEEALDNAFGAAEER